MRTHCSYLWRYGQFELTRVVVCMPRWFVGPNMVTHLSTCDVWYTKMLLIRTNAVHYHQAELPIVFCSHLFFISHISFVTQLTTVVNLMWQWCYPPTYIYFIDVFRVNLGLLISVIFSFPYSGRDVLEITGIVFYGLYVLFITQLNVKSLTQVTVIFVHSISSLLPYSTRESSTG